jgi:hypothetical protein
VNTHLGRHEHDRHTTRNSFTYSLIHIHHGHHCLDFVEGGDVHRLNVVLESTDLFFQKIGSYLQGEREGAKNNP